MHLILISLTPSLLWLWYFRSQDRYAQEGARPLARCFLWGAVVVMPAIALEISLGWATGISRLRRNSWQRILDALVIVGPVEELLKYHAANQALNDEPCFKDPTDGLVYSAATALGFAFAENLFYMANVDAATIMLRTLMSVPGHVLFAVCWGAPMGRLRCIPKTAPSELNWGLFMGCLFHGLYDALCFQAADWHGATLLVVALITLQWRHYRNLLAECVRLRRIWHVDSVNAGAAVEATISPSPAPLVADPPLQVAPVVNLQWRSVLASLLYGCGVTTAFAGCAIAIWQIAHFGHGPVGRESQNIDAVLVFLGLLLSGILAPYRVPGRSLKETALGLSILGAGIGLSTGLAGMATSALSFATIGAFGAWLGESLQAGVEKMRRPDRGAGAAHK